MCFEICLYNFLLVVLRHPISGCHLLQLFVSFLFNYFQISSDLFIFISVVHFLTVLKNFLICSLNFLFPFSVHPCVYSVQKCG
jgi:hypothetical protein